MIGKFILGIWDVISAIINAPGGPKDRVLGPTRNSAPCIETRSAVHIGTEIMVDPIRILMGMKT